MIAEYVNGSLSKEYIYSGGQLLATIAGGATTYAYSDQLSTRVETDSSGAITRSFGHFPFGESWYETGAANKWKFTSYERDSESNLDYALNRFDSSRLGRFMSPDLLSGSITAPQSLNHYSYVNNDPVNASDASGLCPECRPILDVPNPCPWCTSFTFANVPVYGEGAWVPVYQPGLDGGQGTVIGGYFGWGQIGAGIGLSAFFGNGEYPGPAAGVGVADPSEGDKSICKGFVPPLNDSPPVTTEFGQMDDWHSQPHTGRDYAVPIGTPVFSPFAGQIAYADNAGTFGKVVIVSSPNANTYLGHLSRISVNPGLQVPAGLQVGSSGSTGHSSGPHLHFEMHTPGPIWVGGHAPRQTAVEPCKW